MNAVRESIGEKIIKVLAKIPSFFSSKPGLMNWKLVLILFFIFCSGVMYGGVATLHINFQDSWILEFVLPEVIFSVIIYALYVTLEDNPEATVIASVLFVLWIHMLPGLKYTNPYGAAIDQGVHRSNLAYFLSNGFLPSGNIYSDEPGIYVLLRGMQFDNSISADDILKYGVPIIFSVLPFVVYIIGRIGSFSQAAIRYSVIASVIAADPYIFTFQGGSLGALLLLILCASFWGRERGDPQYRLFWTILTLFSVASLIWAHAITSVISIIILIIAGFILDILKVDRKNAGLSSHILFVTLLIGVFLVSWWILRANLIFDVMVTKIFQLINTLENPIHAPIPNKFFKLDFLEQVIIIIVFHVDFLLVFALSFIGSIRYLRGPQRPTITKKVVISLISIEFALIGIMIVQFILKVGQIEYFRFITYFVIFTPFLAGIALISVSRTSQGKGAIPKPILEFSLIVVIIAIAFVQIFPYQPILPASPEIYERFNVFETTIYLHQVVSEYQTLMLNFYKNHLSEKEVVEADIATYDIGIGVLGFEGSQKIFIASPVSDVEKDSWSVLLYHRPIAGPYFEQAPFRTLGFLPVNQLPVDDNLLYDNGGSFILTRNH